ncbi:MAG: hypothetical protein WCD27_05025 [Candidatus Acidiferrales bacterium]
MTDIIALAAISPLPFTIPFGVGAYLMTKMNEYINNQLCGGPSVKFT